MRTRRCFVKVLTVALAALGAHGTAARATPNFTASLQSHLGLAAVPDCSLCHSGATQRGTVTTPIGAALRMHGLVAYDDASLFMALDALAAEHTDSDGDGVSDIDELKMGTNPNVSQGGGGAGPLGPPIYGCAAARTDSDARAVRLGGLVASLLCFRRRARRPRTTRRPR